MNYKYIFKMKQKKLQIFQKKLNFFSAIWIHYVN